MYRWKARQSVTPEGVSCRCAITAGQRYENQTRSGRNWRRGQLKALKAALSPLRYNQGNIVILFLRTESPYLADDSAQQLLRT